MSSRGARDFVQLKTSMAWLKQQRSRRLQSNRLKNAAAGQTATEFQEEIRHLLILGRYFSAFYDGKYEWLIRRVDTVELLDSSAVSSAVRTSLMIDGAVIARLAEDQSVSREVSTYIPLLVMEKHLLGRFDVQVGGTPIPVLPRRDNAHAVVGMLLSHLVDNGVPFECIGREVVDTLYLIASCDARSSDAMAISATIRGAAGTDAIDNDIAGLVGYYESLPQEQIDTVEVLLNLIIDITHAAGGGFAEEFARSLTYFLENFMQIGILSCVPDLEFMVKVHVSSSSLRSLRGVHSAMQFVDDHRALFILPGIFSKVFVGCAVLGALFGDTLGVCFMTLGLVSLAVAIVILSVKLTQLYREHGSRWLTGLIAFRTYSTSVVRFFPVLSLSGIYSLQSDYTNLGLSGSQHYRLAVPKGATAVTVNVKDRDKLVDDVDTDKSEDWVAAHSIRSESNSETLSIEVGILPRVQSFLRHSFYAAFVTSFLLGVGLISHLVGQILNLDCNGDTCGSFGVVHLAYRSSGSIVTVLMIAPSVYTIILLQQNEHEFVSMLLRNMRGVVGVCALMSASVAIPLALDLPTLIVISWWIVGLCASAFACWHLAATRYYHGALLALY